MDGHRYECKAAISPATDIDCDTGNLTELMGDLDGAINAYEQALRHNTWSVPAMNAISSILRTREQFPKAIEYLQNILKLDPNNGEVWGSLGLGSSKSMPTVVRLTWVQVIVI